jgi:hypothetical protein
MKIHRVDFDMALVINQKATTNSYQTKAAGTDSSNSLKSIGVQ